MKRDSAGALRSGLRKAFALLVLVVWMGCSNGGGSSATAPSPPTPPPPPPPPQADSPIGIVGCSQTTTTWRAWRTLGDQRPWHLEQGYSGGSIVNWAAGAYWARLDANIAGNEPAMIVWWELCDLSANNATTGEVETVLDGIRSRIPGATIYVSPLPEFEKPETCPKQDIAHSRVLVDDLVARGLALRGPELPRVLDAWIQEGDGSGCHVGTTGGLAFGEAMMAWQP